MFFRMITASAILAAGACCFEHVANAQLRDSSKQAPAPVNTDTRLFPTYFKGGQDASFNDYPFQVAIINSSNRVGHEFDDFRCDGTLIGKEWVLTAAHCVSVRSEKGGQENLGNQGGQLLIGPLPTFLPSDGDLGEDQNLQQTQNLDVYIGPGNLEGGDRIAVSYVYKHPNYRGWFGANDVALLKLEREPRKDVSYGIVELADDKVITTADTEATAVGWRVGEDDQKQWKLQRVALKILEKKVCNENAIPFINDRMPGPLGATWRILLLTLKPVANVSVLDDTMICAGGPAPASPDDYKESCQDGSGGPLLAKSKDDKLVQIGISSWVCSLSREKPSAAAYTRVGDFINWINAQEKAPPPEQLPPLIGEGTTRR